MTRGVTASNAAASRIVSKCRGPRSFSFGFTHPKLSNASAMTILSVAARLLAKAALLPFSRVGQSLTIPAKAHRRSSGNGSAIGPAFPEGEKRKRRLAVTDEVPVKIST
jgi:hypothetical protein